MIHAIRTVTVGDNESIIDKPIILYRGDREVEIEFTLLGNEFRFSDDGNVIKSANASHGQLVLNTPNGENMFSEVSKCHDGNVVFIITKEMIDEFIEVGFYSFQIRLYDGAEMKSRMTIPPVLNGIDIRNPIAAEDETNVVDQGIVDYARIFKDQSNEELPTFDWTGAYNKTEWVHHDVITENTMNKIEDALYSINANVKESDVVMLNTLDKVKKDVDKYVQEHMAEVEADVDEFERNLNTGVQQFKINTNAAMTAHKNEVSSQLAHIEVNVKDFGAKGDDSTDDTQSFIDAINKAETTTKHIKIPSGIYQIQGVNIPSNFTITLEKDATIKLRSGYLNPIFTINNNTTINNGYFDGNRNSQNGAYVEEGAIHVIGDYNVFNNIELFNARAEGLLIKGNNNIVNGGVFRNNENGSGIAIGNGIIDAVHNKVYKAHCHSCQGSNFSINGRYTLLDGVKSTNSLKNNAITLGHPNSPADYSIIQNSLIDGGLEGIGGQAGTCNVVIRNNTIMNMNGNNGAGIIITDLANSFRIEGNLIKNCKNGIVLRYPNNIITNNMITENNIYGVRVELESINNTFSNNLIQLNNNNGIHLSTPSNIIVNNNILNNSQGSSGSMGIYMASPSKFNIIEGNNISDTQTTKTQYRGIYCEGAFNTIKDNVCLYNTNKGIITVPNNYLKNNRQSDVDDLVIEVDLSTTEYTTTVSNYNISPTSILQLELISQAAIKNNARITNQTNGACVITCDSLDGGKVILII